MSDFKEKELFKTFIGNDTLDCARISKTMYDGKTHDMTLELNIQGEYIYMPVNFYEGDTDRRSGIDTAKEFAAVLNTFVAEIEAEKEGIING